MEDLKIIVGKNLAALRKKKKLTQIELADKFNYSDKAVSKWEQGATLPDLETLCQLCDFYGVSLDYLRDEKNIMNPHYDTAREKTIMINHIIITLLLASIVWMIATIGFVYPILFRNAKTSYWLFFVWAVPATCVTTMFANVIFFKKNKVVSFIMLTIFVWSLLAAVFLHFMIYTDASYNLWMLFLLGIPSEIILILWFIMRKK